MSDKKEKLSYQILSRVVAAKSDIFMSNLRDPGTAREVENGLVRILLWSIEWAQRSVWGLRGAYMPKTIVSLLSPKQPASKQLQPTPKQKMRFSLPIVLFYILASTVGPNC